MSDRDTESSNARQRREGHEEELELCNEAVESGVYDLLSDKAWERLCEQTVAKGRKASQTPEA